MGEDVERRKFTRQDRHEFRQKVQDCLDALAIMLADETFHVGEPQIGMEIELNLVDDDMEPSMANAAVLDAIADPDYQTELGQFNIEINVDPRPLRGASIAELETDLRRSLNAADERARTSGSRLAMIGMLPTLDEEHFEHRWLSANPRYDLLNQQIFAARGEDIELKIGGVRLPGAAAAEDLDIVTDTILPEAACTSVQLHLQVAP
ncbi:MAG: glutamate--cysteine ligase, partial [Rhodococcus sp. (in: high G+C Gram-positive bacteria)]